MIKKKQHTSEMIIDLTGPDGNAFNLLGIANKLSKMTGEAGVVEEMKTGDYEHLIRVFDRHFGSFVTLLR